MIRKWNKAKRTIRNEPVNRSVARNGSKKWTWAPALVAATIFIAIGGILNIPFEEATKDPQTNQTNSSKLASILRKPAAMQPFPEMPTEALPGMSVQPERLTPEDALTIQKIDPIITGPRIDKPRANIERTASKDS